MMWLSELTRTRVEATSGRASVTRRGKTDRCSLGKIPVSHGRTSRCSHPKK